MSAPAQCSVTSGESRVAHLEPESEVRMINQRPTYVRRFSMTPIIASLANPTAIMARAS